MLLAQHNAKPLVLRNVKMRGIFTYVKPENRGKTDVFPGQENCVAVFSGIPPKFSWPRKSPCDFLWKPRTSREKLFAIFHRCKRRVFVIALIFMQMQFENCISDFCYFNH